VATTYQELLARVIDDGIKEVKAIYTSEDQRPKLEGAIDGFTACQGKPPLEIGKLYEEATKARYAIEDEDLPDKDWSARQARARYRELQIEWVCNVISAGLCNMGADPLFAHMPTSRGVLKYAEIVGVHPDPATDARELAAIARIKDK
jgi:hypothetical protein